VRRHAALVAVLLVATLSRFWAIGFCLPSTLCRPDEEAVVAVAGSFFARHFNPHFFDWPSFFMYELTAAMVPFFKAGLYAGWWRGERNFIEVINTNPAPIFLIARLLSASAGVATVWLVHRAARRLFDDTVAIVAALFLAVSFLHARDSHFGVTDITATMLVVASFVCAVRYWQSGRWWDLACSALLAGVATGTKYNAAIVAVAVAWAVVARPSASPVRARMVALASAGTLVGLGFFVASPYCLIAFNEWLQALGGVVAHLSAGHGVVLGRGWRVHLTSSLALGVGWPMLVAGIAGLALAAWARGRTGVLLGVFPVLYYAITGAALTVFARYILPVVPFLCLAAAYATVAAARWACRRAQRPALAQFAVVVLVALVALPTARATARFDWLLGQTDSRVMAEQWVRAHYPDGTTIAETGRESTRLHFVAPGPGQPSPYRSVDPLQPGAEPVLLVVPTSLFDADAPMDPVVRAMVRRYTPVFAVRAHDMTATGNVYDWQDEFYLPLSGFQGIDRPGPNLHVYRLPGPGVASPPKP
jgi:hypothetical protein